MIDQEEIHKQCFSDDPKKRVKAVEQLKDNFSLHSNKEKAWNDLIKLANSEDWHVNNNATYALISVFSQVPDKQQAWNDLVKLATGKDSPVRFRAASILSSVFPHVPDQQKAEDDLHKMTIDKDSFIRRMAASVLGSSFTQVPDKRQAWNDLHRMITDEEKDVRRMAASALGSVFSQVPDKQQTWDDLIKLTTDKDNSVRSRAVSALGSAFPHTLDKQKAWDDLHRLTTSNDSSVRSGVAHVLGSAFSHVPDKQQAWSDLHRLATDNVNSVRSKAAHTLGSAFSHVPGKQKAWNDLHRLTTDEDRFVRCNAAFALGSSFSHVPDKQKAWNEIHKLTTDEDSFVRSGATFALHFAFSQIPDKQQAWDDLIKLTTDENSNVKSRATAALSSVFSDAPDKQKAWNDLHRITTNENSSIRSSVVSALGPVFSHVPDKQKAWNDLHRLTTDEDSFVRSNAAFAFFFAFSQVPDKQQAWNDLVRLTTDENSNVKYTAVDVLGSAFSQVPDKQQAWSNLIKLSTDEDNWMRHSAVFALGSAFSQVPDKQQAWSDIRGLTINEDSVVRRITASALGSAFSHVPDKQKAWNDLHRLSIDKDEDVRIYANHSLGKVSIFKASQAEKEEDYKRELEIAIEFFKKAAQESELSNPSQFCLPFYRSFHTIVFKKQEAKEEVDKYLAEAKKAVGGSKSKELLFEAVNNLANALKEVQDLENRDLEEKKGELNYYRQYCDRAAELMRDTEGTAPFATIAMKKGLPILDRNLKELLEEIQKKAKIACQVSQGTSTQEIACSISKEVQTWEIGSQEEMAFCVERFIFTLESKIPRLPENENIFKIINESKDQKDINKLLENASELIEIIPEITIDPERMKPTIGIITALPKEYAAVNILLENKKDKYKISGYGAGRRYCLGEILSEEGNKHNLVLATSGMGNNIAATRAALLLEHFPNVKSIIMVGIAGGVPNPYKENVDDHVRLGDIVVSNENGVIQYDLIKQEIQEITCRNPPRPPSSSLIEAVRYLEAEEILGNRPWEKYIAQSLSQLKIDRPSEDKDILHNSDNQDEIISHPEDPKRVNGQPRVFTGPIASANILQKDPNARDKLRDKFKVKAIEMEASGIADATWNHEVGYLVVRGICDYCDSHKNDEWQQYAAVVAAAYTRALIESIP
ncbi:TPA: phosphorylase [Methanosarcina acetivorans]|uniref:Phosphorylase n=2 Tax=Methanosarcina acetivorans TaxID=2214 RepID=Q8TK58_METAC|nr:HEAT repeat domain-containing protein [Methanosarcina acetivorans]AAM06921.1 phosphorylase [Methanosarcina acetivorans C2A]HIH94840.1 phosphorylase [Methanosarcina acetivorans]